MKEWGIRLNGSTQYVDFPDNAAYEISGSITISIWAKASVFTTTTPIISRWNETTAERVWGIALEDTLGYVRFDTTSTGTFQSGNKALTTERLKLNQWHHIVAVNTPTLNLIYIDGVLRASTTLAFAGLKTTANVGVQLGRGVMFGGATTLFNGSMKDARIYASVLSAAQIRTMYEQGPNMAFGTTVLWAKVDEGTGTSCADSSATANTGTIVGRTTTGATPSTMWVIDPVRPRRLMQTEKTSSVLFNGITEKVVIADNATLKFGTGNFTVEARVYPIGLNTAGVAGQVVDKFTGGTGWYLYFNEATGSVGVNKAVFTINSYAVCSTNTPMGNNWYHLIVSVDKSSQELFRVFVNGVYDPRYLNASSYSTNASGTTDTAASLEFMDISDANYKRGNLYDVRLYNRALTDDECLSRYYTNENITSGRVGYWPMDEGSGTVITDRQGTNNGTLTGGTWVNNVQS